MMRKLPVKFKAFFIMIITTLSDTFFKVSSEFHSDKERDILEHFKSNL